MFFQRNYMKCFAKDIKYFCHITIPMLVIGRKAFYNCHQISLDELISRQIF